MVARLLKFFNESMDAVGLLIKLQTKGMHSSTNNRDM